MIDYSQDGALARLLRDLHDAADRSDEEKWATLVWPGEGALASFLDSCDRTICEDGVSPAEVQLLLLLEQIDHEGPVSTYLRWSQLRLILAAVSAAAGKPMSAFGIKLK